MFPLNNPAELFPALDVVPNDESLIVGALVCGLAGLKRHFQWRNRTQQPAMLCVVEVLIESDQPLADAGNPQASSADGPGPAGRFLLFTSSNSD